MMSTILTSEKACHYIVYLVSKKQRYQKQETKLLQLKVNAKDVNYLQRSSISTRRRSGYFFNAVGVCFMVGLLIIGLRGLKGTVHR